MTKLHKEQIDSALDDDFIWDDYMCDWYYEYHEKDEEILWNSVHNGEMSWQWYMEASIRKSEGWHYVVTSHDHKPITVINWLRENYPDCEFRHERNHFLFKDQGVATMVTLKWT